MAPDCAIVHQPVLQKDLLAGNDVVGRKDDGTGWVDESIRNWRRVLVSLRRQQNKHGETTHHRNEGGDPPPRRQ